MSIDFFIFANDCKFSFKEIFEYKYQILAINTRISYPTFPVLDCVKEIFQNTFPDKKYKNSIISQ